MEKTINIAPFLDENGRVTQLPRRQAVYAEVLRHLAEQFDRRRDYTEKEVNAVIDQWHTFRDYFVLRRGLVDFGLLGRTPDGTRYWKIETDQGDF